MTTNLISKYAHLNKKGLDWRGAAKWACAAVGGVLVLTAAPQLVNAVAAGAGAAGLMKAFGAGLAANLSPVPVVWGAMGGASYGAFRRPPAP